MIPFGGLTQQNTVTDTVQPRDTTISIEFYNLMTTCPIYLNDCEKNRRLDSIANALLEKQLQSKDVELYQKDVAYTKKERELEEQKTKTKKANRRTVIVTVVGYVGGIITAVFLL